MARGQTASIGDERTAPNGYQYRKTENGWELIHKLVAEAALGRKLQPNERCRFKDGDRNNLEPDNIIVYTKREQSVARERARIEAKIEELQAQLAELETS